MNENETSQQQNEQIKEQDEEDYDMSGTIIFQFLKDINTNGENI